MIKGIDISEWQEGLNLSDVKKAGYEFAILRAGYTGYGSRRTKSVDGSFESFYAEAKKAGLPVGAYWFSCADSADQGRKEAEVIYNKCLKGKQFEYPIYIDVEDEHWQASNKEGVTDAIIAFCDYLEEKGYYVGVYASLYWFNSRIDTFRLSAYTKWVACWDDTKPSFDYNAFDIWQYTDQENVAGMKVDGDISYIDFPKIIKEGGFNGYSGNIPAEPSEEPKEEDKPVDNAHEIKASQPAVSFNEHLAGSYRVNSATGLNLRDGAGIDYKVLVALPCGHIVQNYGYYTDRDGVRWLYIATDYGDNKYTGFVSQEWLS